MSPNNNLNKINFRNSLDIYVRHWKWILLSLILAIIIASLYLRYSTFEYETRASILIQESESESKLSELTSLQNYGMFAESRTNIIDEVKTIKSSPIVREVVEDLNLNISYYVLGNIKEQEIYLNPPINLNFLADDSLIQTIDTTFSIKILGPETFQFIDAVLKKDDERSIQNEPEFNFGEAVPTGFGDLIITPNEGTYGSEEETILKVNISSFEKVVDRYRSKIDIETEKQSNVITLKLRENLRDKAELILNTLIEKYNEDVINDKERVIQVTGDFINNRLEIVSEELEQVDLTAEALKKDNRLSDISSQSNIFLQTEKENEAKLIAATNQLQLIDYMDSYLDENETDSDLIPANIGIDDNSVAQLTKNYNDLVLERDRILRGSSDKNPVVINLNSQINALKNNLDQTLDNLRSSTQISLNSFNKQEERIRSQIYATPRKERQFRDITRQQSIKESLYLYLLEKREETAITLGMSVPNAKIIEPAYSSISPVSPIPNFTYLAALILGLVLPIGLIYIKDLLDTKIHSRDDIVNVVNAPYIGDIPRSANKKKDRLISKVDYSPKAEAFRLVRTNIEFMLKAKNDGFAKTIFVTSTIAQEGKSHTAVNLATSISHSEKKVLLIETDVRIPKLHDYLNIKNDLGLTDFISDPKLKSENVITKTENKYLDVILSGTIPPNPAELMLSNRFDELLNSMKRNYDYIIADTAAVGLVTDTLIISHHADLFVYVISADKLDKRQLHVARSMYEEKRLPNMAVLLNGTRKRNGYGYGYGYGKQEGLGKKWYQFGKS